MEPESNDVSEHFPIIDAIDHEILMHRDAHFGGLFSIMLDYYNKDGKGIQPEYTTARIERLAELEKHLKQNLAPLFLTGEEAEKVADAKDAYQKLRSIYEVKATKNPIPKLIADLIFSEDEEAVAEIEALVVEKNQSVPFLIDLLRQEDFYNPLFPGYGQAPFLAVKSLGRIGDKRALISLFEAIGQGDFFSDEHILKAFQAIGLPARDFLLKVVKGRPLNEDNERAAIALIAFKDDPEVANVCFELLQQTDVQKDLCLSTYLILACVGLNDPEKKRAFMEMAQNGHLEKSQREDIKAVVHEWSQNSSS
jgi:hypothetical protein